MIDYQQILAKTDHTALSPTTRWRDIEKLCQEGLKYNVASICVAPAYVEAAKRYLGDRLKVCTVIGFPNGNNTTYVKLKETDQMLNFGANEIDMVINIGLLKDEKYKEVEREIRLIKSLVGGRVLKVIIETCLLTNPEKIKMCEIITNSGADFIKTSTGFSKAGATIEDIMLFKENLGKQVKIKAAGGISSLEDAQRFLDLGADRLGSSKIVSLVEKLNKSQ